MNKKQKSILVLQAAFIIYLIGCVLWYFFWYKNSKFSHILIIVLVIGGTFVFISEYKVSNIILKSVNRYKTFLIALFLIIFISVAGVINNLAQKRVDHILNEGSTKNTIATVVNVDMRSTRSGKQAWSFINYTATGQIIEQSFADTSDPKIGQKYLIKYSLQHPDMFKVLKMVK